ncbi:unnamed protein product [Chilo suppressalis]|uniref:tRNA (cytosine(38)-C(5))-methyltransferase n=1 Tax=Chilo suppressalis TaxID=168631 RepID=A0ABN8L1L9_CHISP|nr:hypothetical protein evm_001605 [Chilo suppressalis]CAH2981451.1 unnamed protein product [Chilo suppressalis]
MSDASDTCCHRILELYSGIGGMHCAWNSAGIKGKVVVAVDINTVANEVYQSNFPDTNIFNRNIQSLTSDEINGLKVDTILMSPPCQPFTRNGKLLDENDTRANSFLYLIKILEKLKNIKYILMENVKGFENSTVRDIFIKKIQQCNFNYQEFLICPTTVGIPNSRCRYYCIAKINHSPWHFKRKDEIMQCLPKQYDEPFTLDEILEVDVSDKFLLKDKFLKRGNILDICYRDCRRSCCFTKAYSHYLEGTGSVVTEANRDIVQKCYELANNTEVGSDEFIKALKGIKLRFFTPKEILLLMAFPKNYVFPDTITLKQCYRLLGNSVNVKVISELIKILFE